MTKYEWRKNDKAIYLPKATPTIIELPAMQYITIEGTGNPNNDSFAERTAALYATSYALRMMPKKGIEVPNYYVYTVFPLEGHWSTTQRDFSNGLDKDMFTYKIMIRQPEFVTSEFFQLAKELSEKKVSADLLNNLQFETITEGLTLQMLHIGPYETEPATFAIMEDYCQAHGYTRTSLTHKEIYLSDPRKTVPEKMLTVLRFSVSKN